MPKHIPSTVGIEETEWVMIWSSALAKIAKRGECRKKGPMHEFSDIHGDHQ